MNQLQAMRVFVCVVDLGSLNLAGKSLGISASSVTRYITSLEEQVNMPLLTRSTRSISLTAVGKIYLSGCRAIIRRLDQLETELAKATTDHSGTLRIAAPATFACNELPSLLAAYRSEHPRVEFDVTVFDESVDFLEGGFDVCFAFDREQTNATFIRRPLRAERLILVASASWLKRKGDPTLVHDIHDKDLIAATDGPKTIELVGQRGTNRLSVRGPLVASNYAVVRGAAIAGLGVAVLPYRYVFDDLRDGRLMKVLEDHSIVTGAKEICIFYQECTNFPTKAQDFVEFSIDSYKNAAFPSEVSNAS